MTAGVSIERRPGIECRADGRRLVGYAAVFDKPSQDLGGFVETVAKGAFTRSLKGNGDVIALFDHDPRLILGRRGAGTLKLAEDDTGLRFEIDMPETTTGRDLLVSVGRGDVAGASFAFTVPKGGERWTFGTGPALRTLVDVDLHDVTVTAHPAYLDTSVARRALRGASTAPLRLTLARCYLETLEGA